jgi:hypothetical protein
MIGVDLEGDNCDLLLGTNPKNSLEIVKECTKLGSQEYRKNPTEI